MYLVVAPFQFFLLKDFAHIAGWLYWPDEEDEVASLASTFSNCSLTVFTTSPFVKPETFVVDEFGSENKGASYPPAEPAPVASLLSSFVFDFVDRILLKKSFNSF
jgi:hypothetical protein